MATQNEMDTVIPEVDEEGFLLDGMKWTRDIAEILARPEVPQGLTPDHWAIIDYMREYYLTFNSVPPTRMLARRTGFTLRRIKELFPSGLTRGVCKIAGIPRIIIRPSFLYP